MNKRQMTPEEFREAQEKLGLDDGAMAAMLGFESAQNMRRLKADADRPHHRKIMPYTARLIAAYLAGYRPDDWPGAITPGIGPRSAVEVEELWRKVREIENRLDRDLSR